MAPKSADPRRIVPVWFDLLRAAVAENAEQPIVYSLATIDPETSSPRVRSVIHRLFHNTSEYSDSLPLIVTTTYTSSPKAAEQLIKNNNAEICWWFGGPSQQYRIQGRMHLIANPKHELADRFQTLKLHLEDGKTWEEERVRTFNDTMSSKMKVWFSQPTPGTIMKGGYKNTPDGPTELPTLENAKTKEEKELVEKAMMNFSLLVMEPLKVDLAELGVYPNRRRVWTRDDSAQGGCTWKEETVWP
jgi:hypothetical protein